MAEYRKKRQQSVLEAHRREVPGKVPPQNIEAEQCLLGSVLLGSHAFDKVAPLLVPVDFYDPKHQLIFEIMKELSGDNSAVDSLTVIEKLRAKGALDRAGGAGYISSLADTVPTTAHAEDYAKIVREKAVLRSLIDISTGIIESSFKEEYSPDTLLEDADRMLFEIRQRDQKGSMKSVKDMIIGVYQHMKDMGKMAEGELLGLKTGYSQIDSLTSGLQEEQLVIIAARPGVGKTSLALNIGYHAAMEAKTVLIFSFEMSAQDLIRKFLAIGSRVSLKKMREGRFISKQEDTDIVRAAGLLSNASIVIDTDDNGVFEMRAKARSLHSQLRREGKKIDLVIVDYLQLVRPNESIPREQQIAQISRSLKALAREMKVPVIALSQLNRESEKRERGQGKKKSRPKLSDLRESGAIEQDADIVIFIDKESPEGAPATTMTYTYGTGAKVERKVIKCTLIVEKNRNGPPGEQEVWFIPELTAFEEISGRNTDEAVQGNETI